MRAYRLQSCDGQVRPPCENLGIYHVKLISAVIVVAVADSAFKMHSLTRLFINAESTLFPLYSAVSLIFANCSLAISSAFFAVSSSLPSILKIPFYPLAISYAVPVAVNPQFI